MKKYEHKTVIVDTNYVMPGKDKESKIINDILQDGWQLISVLYYETLRNTIYYFTKEIINNEQN